MPIERQYTKKNILPPAIDATRGMRFSGNKFLASPASGDNGIVEARALTAADIAAAGIEPGSNVIYEDAFDLAPDEGISLKYAREDHSHGAPVTPHWANCTRAAFSPTPAATVQPVPLRETATRA